MATTNEKIRMMRYNELKAYVAVCYHFPDKHKVEFRGLPNWTKYTRKKIKACILPEKQRLLFEALKASRSSEHSMGTDRRYGRKLCKKLESKRRRNDMAYSSIPSLTTNRNNV